MKIKRIVALLLLSLFTNQLFAAAAPLFVDQSSPVIPIQKLKPKDIEKMTGKKMGLFQKIKFVIIQKTLARKAGIGVTEKQKRLGRMSLVFGLISFAFLFLPFVTLLALPAAILGLIFGIKSVDGNSNAQGIVGIIASGITLSIFLIVAIALAAIFTSGF